MLPSILPSTLVKANILIDQACHALIADFGLLTIVSDPTNVSLSSSYTQGGTARWMGPELIDPQRFGLKNGRPTKYSDCYALGMVIYETISGQVPFHKHADLTVFVKVLEGVRPSRWAGFTDDLWEMLELCWAPQPNTRPNIEYILHCLESDSPPSSMFSYLVHSAIIHASYSVHLYHFPPTHHQPPAAAAAQIPHFPPGAYLRTMRLSRLQ